MSRNHHDTGYKELFSHPEFVQQLIEGFTPPELAMLMDFSTLQNHSGNYITPLFEEKFEDVVWSVQMAWEGCLQEVYVYILLEFQSSVDHTMPIRLMHYVACFYDHLRKQKSARSGQGLPPVFPVVLYNGSRRWTARQDIYEMVVPEPPDFLRPYQPHLRYYLVDEGAYTKAKLHGRPSALSGIFEIEFASSRQALQAAVNRIVAIIEAAPNKHRLDRVITRWLKRHLVRMSADVNLDNVNSLVEDQSMLAENLQHWSKKDREEGRQEGLQKARLETAHKLIDRTDMDDQMIAEISGLTVEQVAQLRSEIPRNQSL